MRGICTWAALGVALALPICATSGDAAAPAPLDLSLQEALERGLRENLGVLIASGRVREAEGERQRALAPLLPQVAGSVGESRQKINLEAYGFPPPPGESPLVGPFNVYDLRLSVAMKLLDLSAAARARAARQQLDATRLGYDEARDRVVAGVASLYLGVLADESRIEAARAQVETARVVAAQAASQKEAGVAAGIDVVRAEVQLAAERQRLIAVENRAAQQRLTLAQAIGLPLDRPLRLTDRIPFAPLELESLEAALARARDVRPDLAAARARLAAAASSLAAARRQRLPSVGARADYGPIGPSPSSAEDTYSVAAGLSLPIFEGGRIAGEVKVAEGRAAEAKAALADLERQVERDVRSAYLDVTASAEQVEVAEQARGLAARQLEQARDRFASGVADNLEVVKAQQDVADANERYVSSLNDYNRAKVALALALGVAEASAPRFLKGESQ